MIDCIKSRLFCEGGGMLFPVEEVYVGKGLVDKHLSSSLYMSFLVIIHGALGFPQGHLQGNWSLWRGRVLMETAQMLSIGGGCGVSTGRLRVGMESIGLRGGVRGVETPETSEPDFTG
jgi:hypothetical protein